MQSDVQLKGSSKVSNSVSHRRVHEFHQLASQPCCCTQARKLTWVTQQSTSVIRMPCIAVRMGETSEKDASRMKPHPEFVERRLSCDGTFQSTRIDPSKQDQRVTCAICNCKTSHYCWGCRCYLCSEPLHNGKELLGRKLPQNFSFKVSKEKEDGTLERNSTGNFIFQTEQGFLSCGHIDHHHHEYRKHNYENNPVLSAVPEGSNESSAESYTQETDSSGHGTFIYYINSTLHSSSISIMYRLR